MVNTFVKCFTEFFLKDKCNRRGTVVENKKVRGALLGEACGDALGYPLTHLSQERIVKVFGQFGLRLLLKNRKNRKKAAPVTENTQLLLATIDGLLWSDAKKLEEINGIYRSYMRWYYSQTGEEPKRGQKTWMRRQSHEREICLVREKFMHERREGAEACLNALSKTERGSEKVKVNESDDACVLTRAIPIGILHSNDVKEAFEKAIEAAYLTHSTQIAVYSCGALAVLVAHLMNGNSIPKALENIYEILSEKECDEKLIMLLSAAQEQANKYPAGKGGVWDYLDSIHSLGSGESAHEALAIAVFALMAIDDPFEAIVASANHNGKSSITASITGALEGIRHGGDFLPNYWTDNLEAKEVVEKLGEKFIHMCEKRENKTEK